jgi:hypothetical protein
MLKSIAKSSFIYIQNYHRQHKLRIAVYFIRKTTIEYTTSKNGPWYLFYKAATRNTYSTRSRKTALAIMDMVNGNTKRAYSEAHILQTPRLLLLKMKERPMIL